MPLHLVFGFTSPERDELPVLLYKGSDGDEVERIVRESAFPRIEVAHRLLLNPRKRWSDDHAAVFASALAAGAVIPADVSPAEVERLKAQLASALAEIAELKAARVTADPQKKELEALTDAQLIEAAAVFEVPVADPLDRKAVIKAILAATK